MQCDWSPMNIGLQKVPNSLSPPSSPVPTPTRGEVPGTPLRTPRPSVSRRHLPPPVVLCGEDGFLDSDVRRPLLKRKMERLTSHLPCSFAERSWRPDILLICRVIKAPRPMPVPTIPVTHTESQFEVLDEIGRGSFGTVRKVRLVTGKMKNNALLIF